MKIRVRGHLLDNELEVTMGYMRPCLGKNRIKSVAKVNFKFKRTKCKLLSLGPVRHTSEGPSK